MNNEHQPEFKSVTPEEEHSEPLSNINHKVFSSDLPDTTSQVQEVKIIPSTVSTSPQDVQMADVMPQPVVKVLSPAGVEYVFMTVALLTTEFGLGSVLIALFNGKTSFSVLAYPAALLIVAVPVFAWLFLRLKKAELLNIGRRFDASKRRSTQFIQIFNFLITFFTTIGFIAAIFSKMAGQYNGSLVKLFLDVLVVWIVSGGVLVYYWLDEHKKRI